MLQQLPIGPVIGPLVIAGVLVEESKIDRLKFMGVKDSKLLTHKQRLVLCKKIKALVEDYKIILVQPDEIDEAVESDSTNLNWLEAKKTIEIIKELEPDKTYIDCPSPNIKKYKEFLQSKLGNIELVVEHKADVKYVVVGAASILAKCTREEEVQKIEKMTGQSIGTGYPSNPICQKFLKENWDKFPDIFRKSWMTWKDQKAARMQKKLDDF